MRKKVLISGNVAIAEGALYAGCRFFGGYPITPSSDIAEYMSLKLPLYGGIFIQMEDEIASMGAIIGASIAGKKAMTATSGPGFSLMQEHVGFAVMGEIPVVIVNVQRGGPSTGLPTFPSQQDIMQARWGTHGDHEIIAYAPYSIAESFELTVKAFNAAEKYRNPVIILSDEVIGHMREIYEMPDEGEVEVVNRTEPTVPPDQYLPYDDHFGDVPPMAAFGNGYRYHITGLNHDKTGFPTHNPEISQRLMERLVNKIRNHRDEIVDIDVKWMNDAEYAIFAVGSAARSALQTVIELREQGMKIGYIRARCVWPFPDKELYDFAAQLKWILVPEMNMGQMYNEVKRSVEGRCKVFPLWKANGEIISPEEITEKIKEISI